MEDTTVAETSSPFAQLRISKRFTDLTLASIKYLHRHQDGYIALATKGDEDDFHELVSIRATDLETCLPKFRDRLIKDAYLTINADWRLRCYGAEGKAYGVPFHASNRLRYLNGAYVDIDYYKVGMERGTVLSGIVDLQKSNSIPEASMIVHSGRGLWLVWLLCDPKKPEQSPRAFPNNIELYRCIEGALIDRLLALGADPAARDAARYIRIPGSLNTSSENTIEWWIQGSEDGGHVYDLFELAKRLRITPTQRLKREVKTRNPAKRRGLEAMMAERWREFCQVWAMRGRFSDGCRHNAVKIYAWLLRYRGLPQGAILRSLTVFGRECQPKLTDSEIAVAWKYDKIRKMRDQTISNWLFITPPEAAKLISLAPEARFKQEIPPLPKPRDLQRIAVRHRRTVIKLIIEEVGWVPSVRKMSELLKAKGVTATFKTVSSDYIEVGIESKWRSSS